MLADQATQADVRVGRDRIESLRSRLGSAFGDSAVFYTGSGRPVSPRAKFAVHAVVGDGDVAKFGRWARAARLPAVVVAFDGDQVLVGPMSRPGRPGCAYCARNRMLAAAAATDGGAAPRIAHRAPVVLPAQVRPLDPDETTIVRDDDPDKTTSVRGKVIDPDETQAVDREKTVPKKIDPEWTGSHGSVVGRLDLADLLPPDPRLDRVIALLTADAPELADHVGEVEDDDVLWHRVIPLPSCDVCGGAEGPGTSLPDGDEPAALMTALAGWVDPLTGVVPWVAVKQPLGPELPFVATAAPPHHIDHDGAPKALPAGWGVGPTRSAAILSAVAEAIERYAPSLPDPDRIVWARPADLDGDVLDPREFPLYEPESYAREGFGFAAFDRRVDHPWVRGTWLGTDKPVWVPAVFTYLAMTLLPEHLICQGTPNGLAAGADAESATVRATLELVERDAMMSAWITGARGRYVDLDESLDDDLRAIIDAFASLKATVEVYLLPATTYGVTAAALAVGDGRRAPGATLALGADRSPRTAIRTAIMELVRTAPHLATMLREHPVPKRPEEVRDTLDHAAYYFPTDRLVAFDRLRCGGTSRLRDLVELIAETSVADLASVLGSARVRVATVDVTSADVAMGPLRVVRAVSPDLQPVSYGHGKDRSPLARLRGNALPANRRHPHPIW